MLQERSRSESKTEKFAPVEEDDRNEIFVALINGRIAEDVNFQQFEVCPLARQFDLFQRFVAERAIRLREKSEMRPHHTSIESAAKISWSKA